MFARFLSALAVLGLASCAAPEADSPPPPPVAVPVAALTADLPPTLDDIRTAHRWKDYYAQEVIAFDAEYRSGGEVRFKHTFYTRPDMSEVRMDLADGRRVYYANDSIRVVPDTSSDHDRLRFQILTWPYFLLAPFKLADPGSNWEDLGEQPYAGTPHASGKLTFDAGVGDAPNDYYIAYQDPDSKRVVAMAYIVTYGDRPVAQAEARKRMISYSDYELVNGIPFATTWKFSNYDPAAPPGEVTGEVSVQNVRTMDATVFEL